jgi:hypothetical protein
MPAYGGIALWCLIKKGIGVDFDLGLLLGTWWAIAKDDAQILMKNIRGKIRSTWSSLDDLICHIHNYIVAL